MKYIKTLHEGDTVRDIYLCKVKRSAETRNGKPYDNLILQDKTGTCLLYTSFGIPMPESFTEINILPKRSVVSTLTIESGLLNLMALSKRL